jgi:hypothetical protein
MLEKIFFLILFTFIFCILEKMTPEIPLDFFILLISLSILTQASPTRHPQQNNANNYTQYSQKDNHEQFETQKPQLKAWTITPATLSPEALHYIQNARRKRDVPPAPRIQTPSILPVID